MVIGFFMKIKSSMDCKLISKVPVYVLRQLYTVFSERSKNFGYSRANAEQVEGRVYETPRCEGHSSDGLPQHQGAPLSTT